MDILNSKSIINDEINNILKDCNDLTEKHNQQIVSFSNDIKRLNDFNGKLLMETNEKDKLLSQKDKTIYDYEQMINKNEEELNHKEKFDIIRNQDKLINDQKKTIESLMKLTGKPHKDNELKLSGNIGFSPTSSKKPHQNQFESEPSPYGDIQNNIIVKFKEVEQVDHKEEDLKLEVDHKEEDLKLEVDHKVEDLKLEVDHKEEDLKLDVEVEVEVEDVEDEDGVEVDIIMYRKKEYYIIIGEQPQYIYNIQEDKDIGEKIGEINGKKKVFYKTKK